MNTITMKINFAKPDTNLYSWQPSTINHPYEIQNFYKNSESNCYRRNLPLLGSISRASSLLNS